MGLFSPNIEKMKERKDVDGLLKALTRDNWQVRMEAAQALGESGDPSCARMLVAFAVLDPKDEVRWVATDACIKVGAPTTYLLVGIIDERIDWEDLVNEDARRILTNFHSGPIVPNHIFLIGEEKEESKRRAKEILVKMRGTSVVESLIVASREQKPVLPGDPLIAGIKSTGLYKPFAGNFHQQSLAVRALGEIGDPRAVEALLVAQGERYMPFREIEQALAQIGDSGQIEPHIAQLRHSDNAVRIHAAEELGRIGDPRAVMPLIQSLHDVDNLIRSEINQVSSGDPAWAKPYLEDLSSRQQILDSLAKTRADPTHYATSRVLEFFQYVAETLGKIGDPRAISPLIEALRDSNNFARSAEAKYPTEFSLMGPRFREYAAKALGRIGDPSAIEPLIVSLSEATPTVRAGAAYALGKIGDTRAAEPLVALLKDTDATVQWYAAFSLWELNDPRVIDYLATMQEKESYWIDAARNSISELLVPDALSIAPTFWGKPADMLVAYLLAEMGDKRGLARFDKWLREPDNGYQFIAAVLTLAELSDPRSVEYLGKAHRIGKEIGFDTADLIGATFRASDNTRIAQFVQGPSTLGMCMFGFDHPSFVAVLSDILLHDPSKNNRRDAALFLGFIGEPNALPALHKSRFQIRNWIRLPGAPLWEDVIGNVRGAEKTIRRRMRPLEKIIPELKDAETRWGAVRALGQIADPKATEYLLPLLSDPDPDFCRVVAEALGKIGDPRALPILEKMVYGNKFRLLKDYPSKATRRAELEVRGTIRKIRRKIRQVQRHQSHPA